MGNGAFMEFMISASTDIGTSKRINQDSLFVRRLRTRSGCMVFAVLCDGMGGLSQGEIASAAVLEAFTRWMNCSLPALAQSDIPDHIIREQWMSIIDDRNSAIREYGLKNGLRLGTTATAMLLTEKRYYTLNIGDSRAYEITNTALQITKDHSLVAKEVELGNMTQQEADSSPKRNVLTQCVGGGDENVSPDMFFGEPKINAVYMLCSDGFRREITREEIFECFKPGNMNTEEEMKEQETVLIELNKRRGETDNISVITVCTRDG
jgi:serine/threonine protein phosphatase PrpC